MSGKLSKWNWIC